MVYKENNCLKEADAFSSKGYDVTVVTINGNDKLHSFDKKLMHFRKWRLKTINFRKEDRVEKINWLFFTITHLTFICLSKITYKFGIAERAAIKGYSSLLKLAKSEKADIYIVHHAEALAIGFKSAKAVDAQFGFDAEDFQTGMCETKGKSKEETLLYFLEKKYLSKVQYYTAASKGIGNLYRETIANFFTI